MFGLPVSSILVRRVVTPARMASVSAFSWRSLAVLEQVLCHDRDRLRAADSTFLRVAPNVAPRQTRSRMSLTLRANGTQGDANDAPGGGQDRERLGDGSLHPGSADKDLRYTGRGTTGTNLAARPARSKDTQETSDEQQNLLALRGLDRRGRARRRLRTGHARARRRSGRAVPATARLSRNESGAAAAAASRDTSGARFARRRRRRARRRPGAAAPPAETPRLMARAEMRPLADNTVRGIVEFQTAASGDAAR